MLEAPVTKIYLIIMTSVKLSTLYLQMQSITKTNQMGGLPLR